MGAIHGFLSQHTVARRGLKKELRIALSNLPLDLQKAWSQVIAKRRRNRHRNGAILTQQQRTQKTGLKESPKLAVRRIDSTIPEALMGNKRTAALLDLLIDDQSIPSRTFAPLHLLRVLTTTSARNRTPKQSDDFGRARRSLRTMVNRLR
jgi:hypothetical protein